MNIAHWHLMLNHLPITGAAFALIIWLYAIQQNQPDLYRFALGWAILVGLMTIPVYWTGEHGHELLHGLADFSHERVETHEAWGTYTLYVMLGTSILALACLFRLRRSKGLPALGWKVLMSIVFLAVAGLGVYTGHLGGMVHHPEMRPGFTPPPAEMEEHEHMEHRHEIQDHHS